MIDLIDTDRSPSVTLSRLLLCFTIIRQILFWNSIKGLIPFLEESVVTMRNAWWRHQIETFFALLAICGGNSPVTGKSHAQRPVTRSFDVFFLICAWINGWINNRETGDLRRHRVHYDVIVMARGRMQQRSLNPDASRPRDWTNWLHKPEAGLLVSFGIHVYIKYD